MIESTLSSLKEPTTSSRQRIRFGDVAACTGFMLIAMLQSFAAAAAVGDSDWVASIHFGVVALALAICGVLALVRGKPLGMRTGLRPRAIALIGNFFIIPLAALPLTWRPDWLLTTTTIAIVVLYGWVIWALVTLRRGFSVFPEARHLVTRGPYGIVRHPLYAAYFLVYALVALPRISGIVVLIATLGIAAEVMRAKYEEQLLRSVFPSYSQYANRVPAFFSRVGRSPERPSIIQRRFCRKLTALILTLSFGVVTFALMPTNPS